MIGSARRRDRRDRRPGSTCRATARCAYAASLAGTYNGSFAQIRAFRYRRDSPFAPYNGDPAADAPYNEYNSQLLVEAGHTRELTSRPRWSRAATRTSYHF